MTAGRSSEIFYDHFAKARPNRAHEILAAWEARSARDAAAGAGPDSRGGLLKCLITLNIDSVQ